MPRVLIQFLFLLCWVSPLAAQSTAPITAVDSMTLLQVYPNQVRSYDTSWLDVQNFRSAYSANYFGCYAFVGITSEEWQKFEEVPDPRLVVNPIDRTQEADYIFYLLLLVFLIIVIGVNRDFNYFENMFRALVNYRLSLQFAREQASNRTAASVLYTLLFNLLFALFLVRLLETVGVNSLLVAFEAGWLLLFIVISVIYSVKYVFYKFIGRIFGLKEQASYYLSQVFLMNRILALLLLPALTILYYAPSEAAYLVVIVLIVAVASAVVLRYVRGIRITSQVLGANTLHFILYFCTVEILPTLIISKLLLNV